MGGRIEPAEPEPPPAHSLGRVGEDVMGRSGQLVRARSLDADGVAGGEELMARLVVSLALARFLVNCAINFLSFFRYFCSILRPKLVKN